MPAMPPHFTFNNPARQPNPPLLLHCNLLHPLAGMQPSFIVKPAVACGVAHSHSMALALTPGALASLAGRLPLPGLVCEFVNHGGLQHKVYVLGDKVRESLKDGLLLLEVMLCICVHDANVAAALPCSPGAVHVAAAV